MPPKGPHLGTQSRRMTRTGKPVARAFLRIWPSIVLEPRRRRDLSRPMRLLKPPARMQISAERELERCNLESLKPGPGFRFEPVFVMVQKWIVHQVSAKKHENS